MPEVEKSNTYSIKELRQIDQLLLRMEIQKEALQRQIGTPGEKRLKEELKNTIQALNYLLDKKDLNNN